MPIMPENEAPAKRRCIVYVDGFNFYYGVMEENPAWKWLNLQSFFESLRRNEDVLAVKYFTAVIDPKLRHSERRDRQRVYFHALETLPKLSRIEGKYQMRTVTCRAKDCPRQLKYESPEEKKTDVNIAVAMIEDVMTDAVNNIVLVSADSDLEPAVKMIRSRFPKIKVVVYLPQLPGSNERNNHFYRSLGVPCGPLPLGEIGKHQLPKCIPLPGGKVIERPEQWQ